MAVDIIANVETFIISLPRAIPYLGPLRQGEHVNEKGYVIRRGNRTIYPTSDMSVLIKITGESGRVGWGETYGIVAPQAVKAIIDEVLGPVMIGRDVAAPIVLHEDLYDLMRVRGFFGGYYVDSLAGVDIAVWDLLARGLKQPLVSVLGGMRHAQLPAYVSGLPKSTLQERCDLALEWVRKGFKGIKFAAAMSDDGIVQEMAALREALGPDIDLMVDLHWKFTAGEALRLIKRLEPYQLYFAEAPCEPEDIEGQEIVARAIQTPLALGEELRTVFEYRPRFERRCMSIIQPEMGHTGVTEFMQIGHMAHAFHIDVIPHAAIGIGIFMAASLHGAAALKRVPYHEYQHSIFDKNHRYVTGSMRCENGFYTVPDGDGIGVEPHPSVFNYIVQ